MRPLALWIVAAFLMLPAYGADLTIVVKDIRGSKGEIIARLYANAEGFPSDPRFAVAEARVPASAPAATLAMTVPRLGRYGLIVIHDVNADGIMEKTFLGLPEEGYGMSNNPRPLLVPRFSDAVFEIKENANSIEVGLVYY